MKFKNITLKDVAKEAGVSVPTASRVLNNEKFVSDAVRERVLDAARRLNYTPEWSARSLRLRKTDVIGVIIPNVADYFFSSIVLGVEKFFREKGKDIILFNTSNDERIEERAIKLAVSKRVEGIILATICRNHNVIESLVEEFGIPLVIVDNKIDVKNVDFVLCDDVNCSFKLIEHLINVHGYKKIACISGPLDESSGFDKLLGYKKALIDNGIPVKEDYIKIAYWKKSKAYEATRELLSMDNKPEAIYCMNANMLIGCLRYLNEKGVKVPDDVAVLTFDDYDYVSALNPPVTALERIDLDMGLKAAELLYRRINGEKSEYKEIRISPELVIRKSCGCK
ncbi:MAG: LacI family DNA-binding transcriptional regulator [Actinobacteria bacterium]|nr:LacI family DNA-binding transcriptional regulator [Actinomycetota bacterium]